MQMTSLSKSLCVFVACECGWSGLEMLRGVFQYRVNFFNLLVSTVGALTPLVVGMILCVVCAEVESCVWQPVLRVQSV